MKGRQDLFPEGIVHFVARTKNWAQTLVALYHAHLSHVTRGQELRNTLILGLAAKLHRCQLLSLLDLMYDKSGLYGMSHHRPIKGSPSITRVRQHRAQHRLGVNSKPGAGVAGFVLSPPPPPRETSPTNPALCGTHPGKPSKKWLIPGRS